MRRNTSILHGRRLELGSLPPLLRSRMKRVGKVVGLFEPVGDGGLDLVTMCDTDLMPEFDGGCGNDLAYA